MAASAPHGVKTREWLERADQNGRADAGRFCGHVKAVVHAIYKVDVRVARTAEKRSRAWRGAAIPMARWIDQRKIGLGLDDSAGEELACVGLPVRDAAVKNRAHEPLGDGDGRPVEQFAANASSLLTIMP